MDASPRGRRGFTLVELMVVIVILGGLVALVGPRVFTMAEEAHRRTAEAQVASFRKAVEVFYLARRSLPPTLEALTEPDPRTGEAWMDSIPEDPWGRPYEYRPLGGTKYSVRSLGADGVEGTADDLVWPKE